MIERHAVYATCNLSGESITFRIGRAVDWDTAQNRWLRLFPAPSVRGRVRFHRRWYPVRFLEVRAVDRHERGLGSERHERAIPVPYRQFKRA